MCSPTKALGPPISSATLSLRDLITLINGRPGPLCPGKLKTSADYDYDALEKLSFRRLRKQRGPPAGGGGFTTGRCVRRFLRFVLLPYSHFTGGRSLSPGGETIEHPLNKVEAMSSVLKNALVQQNACWRTTWLHLSACLCKSSIFLVKLL